MKLKGLSSEEKDQSVSGEEPDRMTLKGIKFNKSKLGDDMHTHKLIERIFLKNQSYQSIAR